MQPAGGHRTEPPGAPGDECDGTVDDHADLLDVWTADGPRRRAIQHLAILGYYYTYIYGRRDGGQ
jgi:hypothetical protein